MITGQGEVAVTLLKAVLAGTGFPADVQDTPGTRDLFAQIQQEVDGMPDGVVPMIPWDYVTELPDAPPDDSVSAQIEQF